MPDNHRQLHWAQAKVYAWLMCVERELKNIKVALVYYNVSSKDETLLIEEFSAQELQIYFESQCKKLMVWAEQELEHRASRNIELVKLNFPHNGLPPIM